MLDILRWVAGLPLLALLLYLPGAVVLNSLMSRSPARHLFAGVDEWLFTAVLVSFLTTGLVSFILAEIGFFHWWLVAAIVLGGALAAGLWRVQTTGDNGSRPKGYPAHRSTIVRDPKVTPLIEVPAASTSLGGRYSVLGTLVRIPPPYPQRVTDRRQTRFQQGALVVLIILGAVLFSRPSEMLRGALDAGAYINAGVAMARSGSILQRDELMRELNNDTGEVRELLLPLSLDRYTVANLRMPAFYVLDKKAALVLPQHYSLYPAWIGLLYALFGTWGALYATPLLALLLVLAFYYFARRTIGDWPALAALFLLLLCPVTIWFARYPVSEVITGLLAFSAFLAFVRMVRLAAPATKDEGRHTKVDGRTTGVRQATDEEAAGATIDTGPIVQDATVSPGDELANGHRSSLALRPSPFADPAGTWACFWGVVAGVSLGQIALARPDFVFFLAPVPVYLVYWRLSRRWQRPYTWFASSLGAMLLLYTVHLAFFSFVYTLDLYHNVIQDVRRLWGPLLLALYVGVFLLIAIDRLYLRLKPLWVRAESWVMRYRWAWVGVVIVGLAVFFSYKYFYAPWQANVRVDSAGNPILQQYRTTLESYIGAPVDEGPRYNLLRVGWYLSPLGMVAGMAGLLRWVWSRLNAATGLFFGSLLVVGFVFIQETYTEAFYIYSMRRYVPIILPALVLGIAWAAQFLWSRIRPRQIGFAMGLILVAALAVFFAYTDRVIVPHVEESGAVAQLDDLAKRFTGKSVVIFSNERDEPYVVATPLQYIYGVESFVLARSYPQTNNTVLQGVVKRWQAQGYHVWLMMGANGGKLDLPGYSLKEEGTWDYSVPELEQLRVQKPTNISQAYLPWGIYSVQPQKAAPSWPFRLDIGGDDYQYLVSGFNKQERDDASSPYWRWTGGNAILRVPWPNATGGKTYTGGTVTLRMRPESPVKGSAPLRTQPLTVTVTLDNTPIGTIMVPPGSGFVDYTVTVPPGTVRSGADPDYGLVGIKSPTWSPAQAGVSYDQRVLGVQLDEVQVGR